METLAKAYPNSVVRPLTLRKFFPNYQAICLNCEWVSYDYATKKAAEGAMQTHDDNCTSTLNAERASKVPVTPTIARLLQPGHRLLTRRMDILLVVDVIDDNDNIQIYYTESNAPTEKDRQAVLMLELAATQPVNYIA